MDSTKMASSEPNVYLFVPNLIGYARVALMFIAFYFMTNPEMYQITVACYLLSQLLDAFDGHAARLLGQTSKLGAMLDQLTDRWDVLAALLFCFVLAALHKSWLISFFYCRFSQYLSLSL
jgi:CDP-diacylglycerol--inositol 3-phosphatidyltransferase